MLVGSPAESVLQGDGISGTPLAWRGLRLDTLALLRYGVRSYRVVHAVRRGAVLARTGIRHRGGDRVALVATRSYSRVVRRGRRIRVYVHAPKSVDGPLRVGVLTMSWTSRFLIMSAMSSAVR